MRWSSAFRSSRTGGPWPAPSAEFSSRGVLLERRIGSGSMHKEARPGIRGSAGWAPGTTTARGRSWHPSTRGQGGGGTHPRSDTNTLTRFLEPRSRTVHRLAPVATAETPTPWRASGVGRSPTRHASTSATSGRTRRDLCDPVWKALGLRQGSVHRPRTLEESLSSVDDPCGKARNGCDYSPPPPAPHRSGSRVRTRVSTSRRSDR